MKILVSITSYKKEKINFLSQVLNQYDYISNNLKCNIDIVLSTNYNYAFNCKNYIEHYITDFNAPIYWEYCWQNKDIILKKYKNYDYIIESDDDILISSDNILQYIKYKNIDGNYIPGFLVTEFNNDTRYIQSMVYKEPIGSTFKNDIGLFFIPENIHSACYMIDKNRMDKYVCINQRFIYPKFRDCYDVACMSVSEIYFYYKKVIYVDDWLNHMIHHLPNRYIEGNYDPNVFPKDHYNKYRSVDFWKEEIINNYIY